MEQWEALLEACPGPPDLRYFTKAIQVAGVVLKEDLASFEIEWILQTLLHKPVNLLSVVTTQRSDDLWLKVIGDAFKLLADLAEMLPDSLAKHVEDIVTICHLKPLDAQTRKRSLVCLAALAQRWAAAARDVTTHLALLHSTATCKAALAGLLGTICEYHPATVANEYITIWRTFLNLLDNSKNTLTITQALLHGVLGLFKHFGSDLPTAELNAFYIKLSNDYIKTSRCQDMCLKILKNHSNLFREKLSKDVQLRSHLWCLMQENNKNVNDVVEAILSVYSAVCDVATETEIQKIVSTELLQHTASRSLSKYTSLRVINRMRQKFNININIESLVDVQSLEFELRSGPQGYDVAYALSYCLESRLSNIEQLLQTCIVFYKNIPSNKRRDIVVHGILNADKELRTAATNFLISESTLDMDSFEKYQKLWSDMFDTNNNTDFTVVENSKFIFEDFMSYAFLALENYLENNVEIPEPKFNALFTLIYHILSIQPPEEYTKELCTVLIPFLTELFTIRPEASLLSAITKAYEHLEDEFDEIQEFYKIIRIDRCKDEALLCESCLALISAPDGAVHVASVLQALQIIFSRNDVEPSALRKALSKFEYLLAKEDEIDSSFIEIVHQVEKLRLRKDLKGKEARILHRDVVMFLGKYGSKADLNNNAQTDSLAVSKLMETLNLNIQNPEDGTHYKLNLRSVVQVALEQEDPNSLQTLLVIICANLSSESPATRATWQLVTTRTCRALCRAHARGCDVTTPAIHAIHAALTVCSTPECVQEILSYISNERSPGVRKMLSDALEELLIRSDNDELISAATEHAAVMMRSSQPTTKRAGLNITEILINVLKKNNVLTKKLMPNIMVLISKTYEVDSDVTFEIASQHFMDKFELFTNSAVDELISELLCVLVQDTGIKIAITSSNKNEEVSKTKMADGEAKNFKTATKMILDFLKNVVEYRNEDKSVILMKIFEVENIDFVKSLYVLADMRKVFDFDIQLCRKVMSHKNCSILNRFLSIKIQKDDLFCMETVLKVFEEYSEVLIEMQYQKTLEILAKTMTILTPKCVKCLRREIRSSLSKYTRNTTAPIVIQKALQNWCQTLPLYDINNRIEKESYLSEHTDIIFALKTMLETVKLTDLSTLSDVRYVTKNWAKILLNLFSRDYIQNYLRAKMAYLTDILTVSVKFLSVTDVKKLLLEGSCIQGLPTEKIGVKFCSFFMDVFYEVLLARPFILLDEDMRPCSVLINDVVKNCLKKKRSDEEYVRVLELVDKLWPTYAENSSFNQKLSLLRDVSNFPTKLGAGSNPLLWAASVVNSERRQDANRLLVVLPGGPEFSECYRNFVSSLPIKLSEMEGNARSSFRALLDALATSKDPVLLDIIMTLAEGDDTKGWWDDAIESCMAAVANHIDLDLCTAVYTRSQEGVSLQVCNRVLLPLLRYSTSAFCECFFASILSELLTLKGMAPSSHYTYHKHVVKYTRGLALLTLAFEKIPAQSLESPDSRLYSEIKPPQSWHIIRQTCRICATLRIELKLPDDASEQLKRDFRLFHCINYNCLSGAVCRRRPGENVYRSVLNTQVWDNLVDHDKEYRLYIRSQWNQRTKRQPVSIDIETRHPGSLTRTGTRTKMLLRTLTECPMAFDLIEDNAQEEVQTQDLVLKENELNQHESAGTLTALLCHLSTLPYEEWKSVLVTALREAKRNTKWLLAQMICNCKTELKPQASTLRPALLDLIASTPVQIDGKTVLNGLHIDIIETLIFWEETNVSPNENSLNKTAGLLVATCLENRKYLSTFKTLAELLTKFLDMYKGHVEIDFKIFDGYLNDAEALKTVEILQRISKAGIHMQELLPTLLDKLECRQYYQLAKLAELFGLALANCGDKQLYLTRFKKVLDNVRKTNSGDYIKMLYYSQKGCSYCCDEYNFVKIMSLTANIVGPDKAHCLDILTNYISNSTLQERVKEMYETLDLSEMISTDTAKVLNLIKVGVKYVPEGVKRRLVNLSAGFCGHSVAKIRRAALEVVLEAFYDLLCPPMAPPSAKKPKTANTQIMKLINSTDVYVTTILSSLSNGVIDRDADIEQCVRLGIAKHLSKEMDFRFIESFLICVYLPITCNNKSQDLSACLTALLEMLFYDLKTQERFKRLKLRDEPLEISESIAGPLKLLTKSRTYQGTFRGRTSLPNRKKISQTQGQDTNTPQIDVQFTLESILDTLLKFAKQCPQAAQELCINFAKALPGTEPGSAISEAIATVLARQPCELTPFIAELSHVFIQDVCKVDNILKTLQTLKQKTWNTEGERLTKTLYNSVKIRTTDQDMFVLGKDRYDSNVDVVMDEAREFCMEDLTSAFGKLSNWDVLTIQERRQIVNTGLPAFWTAMDTFRKQLDNYTPSSCWFSRMHSAYKREDAENAMKWLRDIDRWPRKHFQVSSVVEAVEWLTRSEDTIPRALCDIQANDCVAEWAGRLLIRNAYMHSITEEPEQSDIMLSRSHEVKWCIRASEMGLHAPVLECVKRNTPDLYKSETLPWLYQKLSVSRQKALEKRKIDTNNENASEIKQALDKILETAETYTPQFADDSKDTDVIAMNKLILLVNSDLKRPCDTLEIIPITFETLDKHLKKRRFNSQNKKPLHSLYKAAVIYLDRVFEVLHSPENDPNEVWSTAVDILCRLEDLHVNDYGLACYIVDKLNDTRQIEEHTARKLLDQLQRNYLNDFVIKKLDMYKRKETIPSKLFEEFPMLDAKKDDVRQKYKKYLQLLSDPEYSLLQYCKELLKCVRGGDSWGDHPKLMKQKLFESPYAGTDYQLLNKYKAKLYEIDFELHPRTLGEKNAIEKILKEIVRELNQKPVHKVLRLSQLCPSLSRCDDCPGDLLGLPDSVTVVKFHEQVPVFTDSLRRPTVLTALLSNGKTKRFLHKSGETLEKDAGGQLVLRYAAQLWAEVRCPLVGYNVTELSEDCGLIEYLDDYERMRDLVEESCDLDAALNAVNRPMDHELSRAPLEANLSQFKQMCKMVPRHALRAAILRRSITQQDFLARSQKFQDTVCSSTVLTWILGLGDRHLQNILCSTADSGVCHVDWGAMFQWQIHEPPPARLTGNILAVCHLTELEARLQQLLTVLQDNRKIFYAAVRVTCADEVFVEEILKGAMQSAKLTNTLGEKKNSVPEHEMRRYEEMVAYESPTNDESRLYFDVEHQITWLLNKCTDTRILSGTRSGWEPWV